MANWFHDLGLFLFAVLAHWQALITGGIVIAAVGLYERKKRTLSWEAYFFIATIFAFYSVFAAWQDEHRNTNVVMGEKVTEVSLKNICLQDARVEHAYMEGLQGMNESQRQTIDKQQQANDAQQKDVSSCVVSLGKMNPIVRLRISVVMAPFATMDMQGRIDSPSAITKKEVTELFILTNVEQQNFRGVLECANPFTITSGPFINSESNAVVIGTPQPIPRSNKAYEIRVEQSNTVWNSSHPAFLRVISDTPNPGGCRFTQTE